MPVSSGLPCLGRLPPCRWARVFGAFLCIVTPIAHAVSSQAVSKWAIDDDNWVSLNVRLRSTLRAVENPPSSESDYAVDAGLPSVRLWLNAQWLKYFKLELCTERQGSHNLPDGMRLIDAVAKLELHDWFNIWGGRMIPPTDRATLDGPYNLATFDFPFPNVDPAVFLGRDTGAAIWGQLGGGYVKYQVGAFEGCSPESDNPCGNNQANEHEHLLYAARVTLNFWDPEPGYYANSDYFGKKQVLAVAAAVESQADIAGTANDNSDFLGWNVDGLMQRRVGGGVATMEGAFYHHDLDGRSNPGVVPGTGWFVLASYLLAPVIGVGQLQPVVRYQQLDREDGRSDHSRVEAGFNYIIDGHKLRMAAMYASDHLDAGGQHNEFLLGLQWQH